MTQTTQMTSKQAKINPIPKRRRALGLREMRQNIKPKSISPEYRRKILDSNVARHSPPITKSIKNVHAPKTIKSGKKKYLPIFRENWIASRSSSLLGL